MFTVDAPRRLFDLYAAHLLGEIAHLDSDYVFINLSRHPAGRTLSYSNTVDIEQIAEVVLAAKGSKK